MKFSHSRVECFNNCPYQFKLRYLDKLETLPDDDPQNPLIVGTALHHAIETDIETSIKEYLMSYPVASTKHTYEEIKLRYFVPKVKELINNLGDLTFEFEVNQDEFKGFIDLLVKNGDTYEIYDFKYSNNIDHYLESPQLHLYKHYFEKQTGFKVSKLGFIFIPKVMIRQKRSENEYQFMKRLDEELHNRNIELIEVKYDESYVFKFKQDINKILSTNAYHKNETRLCNWCSYEAFCKRGEDYMLLPKNERTKPSIKDKKKIYLYGAPFSGKSYLANQFPDVLFLSTDGNYRNLPGGTPPHIDIKNEVKMNGRMKETTYAWEVFKQVIDELEKKDNDFKTIVLDLVDDVYEHCRVYMYHKLGIEHESDSGFGKGYDVIKTEFLSTMKRFTNLDYENILFTSHLSTSEDLTKKGGDKVTKVKTVLNEKLANKLAGMVDMVVQVAVDNGNYKLKFKHDETVFGGSRLNIKVDEINNSYGDLMKIYQDSIVSDLDNMFGTEKVKVNEVETETEVETEVTEPTENVPLDIPEVADAELTGRRKRR